MTETAFDRIARVAREGMKPDGSWNFRVVRHASGELAIHEVFYAADGRIKAWAERGEHPVDAEQGLDGLIEWIGFAFDGHCRAVSMPVLDAATLPGSERAN